MSQYQQWQFDAVGLDIPPIYQYNVYHILGRVPLVVVAVVVAFGDR